MLLRQTLLYLPSQIVGPVAQVVSAIVWTHWLAPAPYGLLTFLIASQELVFLVTLSWWTHYTMRYLGGLDAAGRESFARSEPPILALSFVAQLAVTLLILVFLDALSWPLALTSIAFVGTRSVLLHLGERARTQSRIGVYTVGQVTGSILGFGLALLLVAIFSASPEMVLAGFAVAQLLGLVLMWRSLGLTAGGWLPRADMLAPAFRYGAPLLVGGGFAWMAQNGIRVVIERGAGAAALGLVAVGWGLGQRLASTLSMLVITASFPLAVKSVHGGSREEAYRQLTLGGTLLMGLIVPAAVGLCVLAEPFTTLFVAAPFREMTIAVLPSAAAAGAIRNIRVHMTDPVFMLIERPAVNTAINIADAAIMLLGCAVGLAVDGLVGAVIGSFIATCIAALAGFAVAYRVGRFDFPLADGIRITVASAVMGAFLLAAPWQTIHSMPVRILFEILLGGMIYAGVILVLYPSLITRARRRLIEARG